MKKYLTLFVTLVTTLITAASYADCGVCNEGHVYISGTAGANFINSINNDGATIKFQPGYMGAAAVGYKYNMFRGEVEVAYRYNQVRNLSDSSYDLYIKHPKIYIGTFSAMANAYVDFNLNCIFTPYIGAGIGYANIDTHAKRHENDIKISTSKSENDFAYQGIAGVSTEICENTDLCVEYRYFGCINHRKAHNQNALIGLRRSF